MFRNYLKIAWRHLLRNKSYAFINIAGLSLGIACVMLIFAIVSTQLSFDSFHPDGDRIVRVVTEIHHENVSYISGVPYPLGKALRNDYTFSEKTARVKTYGDIQVAAAPGKANRKFKETDGVAFAEPEFFDIFNFPLVRGDKKSFASANNAFITEKIARKYFPGEDAMGQTIRLDNQADFIVAGILKDIPVNTDRRQEIYLPFDALKGVDSALANDNGWSSINNNMQCFLLLRPGVTRAAVESNFPAFMQKYYANNPRGFKTYRFRVQPLSDIHFNPDYGAFIQKKYIWSLALVGLFLIVTACVNFINLATAQALTRSREVGVRKVLGSMRSQLFWQFIAETTVIALVATVLGYCIAHQVLPLLDQLLQMPLTLSIFSDWRLSVFLLALLILVVFMAGSYPGLVLAGFQPVLALKGRLNQRHIGGFSLRRVLVIVQFTISQLLIISTIVIAGQIHYSRQTDLGFDKDAVVMLPIPSTDRQKMDHLLHSISGIAGVQKASLCFQPPASSDNNHDNFRFNNEQAAEPFSINVKNGDDQYLSTFGLTLVAGRNFYPSDSTRAFIVNETLVRKLHLHSPQEIIGKPFSVGDAGVKGTIVGVVKDFYNYSFRQQISPICISANHAGYANCAVKINMQRAASLLPAFEKIWNASYPDYIWSYSFLDQDIAKFYETDSIMLTLVEVFAGIAIFIGCLGLYGMVSFMSVQKTKEIGVRKVLGAGIPDILWLFGKEFVRMLLIAFLVAAPVAWWAMHRWLEDFAYRIPLGVQVFLLALLSTFLVAALSISLRTLRSALANPVKSLRSE